MTVMALSSVPLGRTPGLPESPQSPFLLQVQGSVRAHSLLYQALRKHFRAFFHVVIITLDKKGLPLSHFMERNEDSDRCEKKNPKKHPIFVTSKCLNG